MTPSEQTDAPDPVDEPDERPVPPQSGLSATGRRRGAPRPWSWILTGAVIGFAVLGIYGMYTPNSDEATGIAFSPTAGVLYSGIFGALVGGLVAAVVLALVVGRRR